MLFQKPFKATMFSFTDFHMKSFIGNAVLPVLQNSDSNVGQRNDVPSTSQAIVKLVNYNSILQKQSRQNEMRL